MPHVSLPDIDLGYELIAFDAQGVERTDDEGGRMSDKVLARLVAEPISDLFCCIHGWRGDVPAARQQYDAWVRAMAACTADLARAQKRPGFKPLVVGLHWPSEPWGDEEFGAGGATSFALGNAGALDAQVERYAQRTADTPAARQALHTILAAAATTMAPAADLSADVRQAYDVLFRESGLASGDLAGPPGADHQPFDANDRYRLGRQQALSFGIGLGGVVDGVLAPLRQLSFWKMKDRGRNFGETGAHQFLVGCLRANPQTRVHLMGHSFGCVVASATVAGPPGAPMLPRPIHSLALVQGALSLWSYCGDIPPLTGHAGYFHHVMDRRLVAGPIITTQSTFDKAVGNWYPLAAGVARQVTMAPGPAAQLPKYGGLGTFGARGNQLAVVDGPLLSTTATYDFQPGRIYNLESSAVICNGAGPSGAHSDICHTEVGHAIWSAALAEAG